MVKRKLGMEFLHKKRNGKKFPSLTKIPRYDKFKYRTLSLAPKEAWSRNLSY